jgi:deoxyribodipyrimidine photo-lyase
MLGCLDELASGLRAAGSGLVVLAGKPHEVLPALARQSGAGTVFAAQDISPFARSRDSNVSAALRAESARLELTPGLFVVEELDEIRNENGQYYSVFTPFYKRWLQARRRSPSGAPETLPPLPRGLPSTSFPTPEGLALAPAESAALAATDMPVWQPGERAARERVRLFLARRIDGYADAHDMVAVDGTSELSPYLHFGCISARELESSLGEDEGAVALRRQLCWRDFYAQVLLANPGNARVEHQSRYRRKIRWENSRSQLDAWCQGRTGYPLVDAAMRQLKQTGWMHNRARMVVGSFLVKDLGIDWRWGERWFMRMLIDGDEANNNGNWQWIASVGVDTQPASRRIYNPTLQQRRFDPDGHYVRRYVPELMMVPDEYLAEPWTMPIELQHDLGCVIGVHYPEPIVEHAEARRAAIARYALAAGGASE